MAVYRFGPPMPANNMTVALRNVKRGTTKLAPPFNATSRETSTSLSTSGTLQPRLIPARVVDLLVSIRTNETCSLVRRAEQATMVRAYAMSPFNVLGPPKSKADTNRCHPNCFPESPERTSFPSMMRMVMRGISVLGRN